MSVFISHKNSQTSNSKNTKKNFLRNMRWLDFIMDQHRSVVHQLKEIKQEQFDIDTIE